MSQDRKDRAVRLWNTLRSNLEDRSVLEIGGLDDALMNEVEAEQIEAIDKALLAYAAVVSPYAVR